jgi:hypothetical protein
MPFSIRLFRRFPVYCAVTYNASPFQTTGAEKGPCSLTFLPNASHAHRRENV